MIPVAADKNKVSSRFVLQIKTELRNCQKSAIRNHPKFKITIYTAGNYINRERQGVLTRLLY
jgi:hypothetical protein